MKDSKNSENIVLSLPILLAMFALLYFTVVNPIIQHSKEQKRQDGLEKCMTTAYQNYDSRWATSCFNLDESDNCQLPASISNAHETTMREDQKICVSIYQAK